MNRLRRLIMGAAMGGGAAVTYTISGTVTDGVNPVAGVTVALGALNTTSGVDGTYNLPNARQGQAGA